MRDERQSLLAEMGGFRQARLQATRVTVIGAGGLAAAALPLLAAAGVGRITIVDGERVDIGKLDGQTLFTQDDQGRPKADVAAERCRRLNRSVTAVPWRRAADSESIARLIEREDIVIDCSDSIATSYILSDTCMDAKLPLISASVQGFGGYVGGFCGGAPSLRAVFPEPRHRHADSTAAIVLPPTVAMLGALQAHMAMALALDLDPCPLGQLLEIDIRTYRTSGHRFDDASEPEDVFPFVAPSELSGADLIVDLRSAAEAARPVHPRAIRIPSDRLEHDLERSDTRLALCCATGLGAWKAAERLKHSWPGEIVLVAANSS